MANNIINELIKERVDIFRSAFELRAKVLFRDDDKQNNLRHPGEFGIYREAIVRDFLHSFLPQRLAIDTGFIVNSLGDVSRQIDLVIYDPSLTPPLESQNRQKFFPVETVIAAGEVRSNVDRAQFKDALIRLSEIKQIRSALPDEVSTVVRRQELSDIEYNPDQICYDQVFTFLICNLINFPLRHDRNFPSKLNDIYKSVEYEHRHNSILSLKDGLLHYTCDFPEGKPYDCSFPVLPNREEGNLNKWIQGHNDDYFPFKNFCSDLFMHAVHCTVGYINLLQYAGTSPVNFLVEKPNSIPESETASIENQIP